MKSHINSTAFGVLAAVAFAFPIPGNAKKPFETIDLGGNQSTVVKGINVNGEVIGVHAMRGFVREPDGAVTTFSGPGSCNTMTYAVSDSGTIAGVCLAGGGYSAFVRTPDGTVTPFVGPGANTTAPNGINTAGTIVGNYQDGTGQHGFIRDAAGTLTTFDAPGATRTNLLSITDKGAILGTYSDGQTSHGFLRAKNGTMTTIDEPDAGPAGTFPVAQNKSGAVTGTYFDSSGAAKSFVRDAGGVFTTLADGAAPSCINKAGIVSGAIDGRRGFTQRGIKIATFKALVAHAKISTPVCINDGGTIAGNYTVSAGNGSSLNYGFIRLP